MRSLAFAVVTCALGLGACEGAPTSPSTASPPVNGPLHNTVYGYVTSLSVPDTIVANEDGFCDIPVTVTNWSSVAAVFDSGSISAAGVKYERNAAAFQALLGGFPVGMTYTATIPDASLTPRHSPAPYSGRVVIKWFDSAYAYGYWADLQFVCKPYHAPPPGWGSGNPPAEWP